MYRNFCLTTSVNSRCMEAFRMSHLVFPYLLIIYIQLNQNHGQMSPQKWTEHADTSKFDTSSRTNCMKDTGWHVARITHQSAWHGCILVKRHLYCLAVAAPDLRLLKCLRKLLHADELPRLVSPARNIGEPSTYLCMQLTVMALPTMHTCVHD